MEPAKFSREQLISQLIADADELVVITRLERDRCLDVGENTAVVDQVLPQLEQLAVELHQLGTTEKIQTVVERHGGGPYPVEDLAALAEAHVDDVRQALAELMTYGLAWPAPENDD